MKRNEATGSRVPVAPKTTKESVRNVTAAPAPLNKCLHALFAGLARAHGQYRVNGKVSNNGKREGRGVTHPKPVTPALWAKHLAGKYHLGIVPIRDDNTCRFGAIDIDAYNGLDHDALDEKVAELPLIVCRSKSGGAHLYLFLREDVPAPLVRRILAQWAAALGHPGAEVFPKQDRIGPEDIGNWINMPYFGGADTDRYAVSKGRRLTPEEFVDLAESLALTEARLGEVPTPTYTLGSNHNGGMGEAGSKTTEGGRNSRLASEAGWLRRRGWSEESIRDALLAFNDNECDPPLPIAEVEGIARNISKKEPGPSDTVKSDAVVDELNQRYGVLLAGNKVGILADEGNGNYALLTRGDFHTLLANRKVMVPTQNGSKEKPAASVWLESPQRREWDRMVFAPGDPPDPRVFNLFGGFPVAPSESGSCELFKNHLWENVAQQRQDVYEWVFGWFAQIVQAPGWRPGTALVLRGRQGTGKSIVGDVIGALLGPYHQKVSEPRYITGNFNAHMARCLLLQAEEAFFHRDHLAAGVLKNLITSEHHQLEAKYKDPIQVRNHLRLFVTSNHDFVIPAGMEERRFTVLDMGEGWMQDRRRFGALWSQLKAGGYARLMWEMMNFDLTNIDLGATLATSALDEQKIASMETHERWMYDLLQRGWLPGPNAGEVPTHLLFDDYKAFADRFNDRHARTPIMLGMYLRTLPFIRRERLSGGAREYVYVFDRLSDCRRAFGERYGLREQLPDAEDQWGPEEM